MTTNRLVFWIAAAAAATPSLAEDSSTQVASLTMDPLVVTSTLGVETVNETLSSVTVIGSETLEQQDPTEMTDILRGQPGINVISNGSFGKNTSVYMRGTGSESTVLLLDGIRIRSATAGSAPGSTFRRSFSTGLKSCVVPRVRCMARMPLAGSSRVHDAP